MTRPRAADDFATIHARLAELRREREQPRNRIRAAMTPPAETTARLLGAAEGRQRPDKGG